MAGRPLKYKTVAELQSAIDGYFKKCEGETLKDDGKPVLNKYGQPVIVGRRPQGKLYRCSNHVNIAAGYIIGDLFVLKDRNADTAKTPTAYKFRSTKAWQRKRVEIKERDLYLCQVCVRKLYPLKDRTYNTDDLEVHHIIPISEDYDKKLDNDYLLTTCQQHHEMAERGDIPRRVLLAIAREQNEVRSTPGGAIL